MARADGTGIEKTVEAAAAPARPVLQLPKTLNVRELSDLLHTSPIAVIKQLMRSGVMANINHVLDYKVAASIAASFGYEVKLKPEPKKPARKARTPEETTERLQPRPPVVTIMGHVDHGKTRLLDAIRKTNVMETEAGGITQHIGAYQVEVEGRKITFLDTPGHEAFTAMRARGAQVTDITVLVVAADDGIMPQTLEAIDHARAAGVPIVVAINKIDKDNANPDRVKQQLADAGLVVEEWGGDVIAVPTSAKERRGIEELLENILLVSEMETLSANASQPGSGTVIEASMDKTRGPMATVLVQQGTLRLGDTVVVGSSWGRIKAMFNYLGKHLRKAEPSTPAQILGLDTVPQVGDALVTVANEHKARALIEKRRMETQAAARATRLSNLYEQISTGRVKELNIILKVDVQGSIEPIKISLEQLVSDEVKVRVIHSATGNVTESDVMLAIASRGLIIGFNTGTEPGARRLADVESIDIQHFNIIYDLVDNVAKALKGMLEPVLVEVVEGLAEVRNVFSVGKKGKVAGVSVKEGKVTRGARVRVRRGKATVADSVVNSLKRFKEDASEVASGYECGVGLEGFNAFEVGDLLEFYRIDTKR
ncbi:MAG: translation initiation factor IF-2 [Chloroflexota bacterium]